MMRKVHAPGRSISLAVVTALMAASCTATPTAGGPESAAETTAPATGAPASGRFETMQPYVGMWVTEDGYIRHELLPDGRYDEARGSRESAYTGSYVIKGNRIEYVDDTGFTADGEFVEPDVLHHGGYVFRRVRQ
jgi:hypothetical protein